MSDETTSRTRARRPAVAAPETEGLAVATATENALEAISASVLAAEEATARAVARATESLNAAVAAAEAAAERAAAQLNAKLAESLRASEALTGGVAARLAAAQGDGQAAVTQLSGRITERMKAAEASIEAAVRTAGEQLETRAARAVADTEAVLGRLAEHVETQRALAEETGRHTVAHAQRAFAGTEAAGAAVVEGLTRAGQEMAEFVGERIRHDLDTQGALLACRTLGEVSAVQSRFVRTAMEQYAAEANRIARLGSDLVSRSLERAR